LSAFFKIPEYDSHRRKDVDCTEDVRLEVFMTVKIIAEVFWVVTSCNAAAGY
jgi:hypothetical protein